MSYCGFDGCSNPVRSRFSEWCEGHYYQKRRGKELKPLKVTRHKTPAPKCQVFECPNESQSHYIRLCGMHAARVLRHGSTDRKTPEYASGDRNGAWVGESVSYIGMHRRVSAANGRASEHTCVGCGFQAKQWAYDHSCPNEKQSKEGPYSTEVARYQPMCVPCHKKFDLGRQHRHPGSLSV
jgi:hypothetical protein